MFTLKYERERRRGTTSRLTFENLPEEAKFEIFARLPLKSLMQFQCVCKSWKNIISSPLFKNFHHETNFMRKSSANYEYLLIRTDQRECLSLFCAETYTKCLDLEFPEHELGPTFYVHGSCNGVLCISNKPLTVTLSSPPIYLWNPSIRRFKELPKGLLREYDYGGFPDYSTFLGFGFQQEENDYKIVKIHQFNRGEIVYDEVEVYSLGLNAWRRTSAVPPLSRDIRMRGTSVHLNGVVYWKVFDYSTHSHSILSFDMKSEVFSRIILPRLQTPNVICSYISLLVFKKSLAVFHFDRCPSTIDIWVLETETWKMIHTISLPAGKIKGEIPQPLCFAKNGGVHVATSAKGGESGYYLGVYDPKSPRAKDTKIGIDYQSMYVDSYRESLILLD